MELLSPAGSPEAVVAAVQSGADAIYLGLEGFNARQGAKNFNNQEFIDTVKYCHERGCLVYVTMNTLVNDREMKKAVKMAQMVYTAGADAVLVQDLGLAKVLRQACPDLTLHASTQMSVHNLAGVYAAAELGMKRVVLSRELSLEQIKYICANSPIEIEVFVHGALCFCYSGQCYMSALIGRRSGNRGMCAQPCRMEYSMCRRMNTYPLSLKDNCLINYMQELENAGVACAKIEGRMKRPEYTAIVTKIYAKAIHDKVPPTKEDMEKLSIAFNRDGFTDGYLTGKKADMHGTHSSQQDRETNRLFTETRRAYAAGEEKRVPVGFLAIIPPGEPSHLMCFDHNGNKVAVTGPTAQPSQHVGISEKTIIDQLSKTGGTPFYCELAQAQVGEGLYLSAAALNEMRRKAINALMAERSKPRQPNFGPMPALPARQSGMLQPILNIQVVSENQLSSELAQLHPATLYVPMQILDEHFDRVEPFIEFGTEVCAVLPRIISDGEEPAVISVLQRLYTRGITTALVGNLGHIHAAQRSGMAIRGDFGLNVFNSFTLDQLRDAGLRSATASFELRMAQVRDLSKALDTELIVYGRLPCMVTEQCIIKQANGSCNCQNPTSISDKMGAVFPIMKEFGCRNVIYNAHKLFLADKLDDVFSAGLWGVRLCFTTESPRECVETTKAYMGLSSYEPNGLTRGLYYRGVE